MSLMAILAEVTKNKCIMERHMHDRDTVRLSPLLTFNLQW